MEKIPMLERILPIVTAILGTVLTIYSLDHTFHYVGWIYLLGLVIGTQCVAMSIRSVFK